ncbi:LPD38 domain-containing protein [Paenibacillus medicaginis]|uniref:LPD38 domain-containing protein n=1 Tax=Paenibacillus medicaginis TaxID=1470560 RepID=A0ABV5C0H3_9BACL
MASRADAIRRKKQGDEARARVLSGMYNQPQQAAISPRAAAIRQTILNGGGLNLDKEIPGSSNMVQGPPKPNAVDPLKNLPPELRMTGPDFIAQSTLGRAATGNPQAVKTVRDATGVTVAPVQGPPAPKNIPTNAYEEWYNDNIADSPIDKIAKSLWGADRAVQQVKAGSLDTATLGLTRGIGRAANALTPGGQENLTPKLNEQVESLPYRIGEFAGYIPPGMAIERGVSKVIGPALQKANKYGRAAITGAAVGAIDAGAQELGDVAFRGEEFNPSNIALGGAIGGVAAPALTGIGAGLQKALSKFNQSKSVPALPVGRRENRMDAAAARSVQQSGTDAIATPYTFDLPEGTPATRRAVENAAEGRNEIQQINSRLRELETQYEQRVIDEYKYLKQSRDNRGGVKQGQLQRDVNGDVVGRTGRTSENPLWYQEFYQTNGRAPTNKDLYQLARQRVDDGFADESGQVPSWRQESGYDDQIAAYTVARDAMRSGVRELDPALNVTEQPLVTQRLRQEGGSGPRVNDSSLNRQHIEMPPEPEIPAYLRAREQRQNAARSTEPVNDEVEEIVQAVQNPRIRDRVYTFLDEAEQNARKRIAARKNRLSSTPVDEWADYAIIGAAKMGKGTIKFADWTEEMVKEFGESFRPKAERAYRDAKEELRRQERRASKEGQAAEKFNDSGIGDATTFEQKISRQPSKRRESFRKKWEHVRTQFVDDLAPLEALEKRVRGIVSSAEKSLYKMARMYKGTPEKANQIVKNRLAPIVDAVEKAGYTADDLGKYALAVHARDVNKAGYKSGFTNAEIEDVIGKYGTPEMEKAREALVQVNKDMMKELVNSGVVSKELADVLDNRWKNYIPLFRSFDDDVEGFGGSMSKSLANVASPVKALKGSERAVIDPLENMVRNIFQSVSAAERNKVASQLANLAKSDPEGKFIRKLDPNEQVGRKNVVNVKVNGENVKYEVEPEVYRAMLNLDQESSNMLMNILSKPASLLRAGATLTPEFSLRNPMRDVLQAFVTSESGFNPITDFTVGLIQSIKKDKLYQEWIDNLGAYGNVLSMDRNVHRKALEKVLKEKPSKKFVNILNGKSLINLLRAITDTTESATKVGEYRAALRSGASPQEAAYRSRDIMDFARAGVGVRQANRIVAFLNANIQGKSKLIRSIKKNPGGTIARMFVSATLPTVGIYLLNRQVANETQKQTIDESPDWLKDTFWLIAVPGTDTVARIPKPFDIAPLFANLPERALQFVETKDPEAFEGFVRRTLSDAALPAQITGLWPFIEGMSNYSFFREGPIIPQREQGWEYRDQYDPVRTTESAKFLAGAMSKITGDKGMLKNFSSPRIMDNTIQGLTAGLGSYGTSALDSILKGVGAVDRPAAPAKRIEQLPFAKAFLVDPLQSTKSIEKLYDLRQKLSSEKASDKINNSAFTRESDLKTLNSAADAMGDINKQIRAIEADKNLSAQVKRLQIEPLLSERNRIASTTMDGMKK